MKMQKTVSDYIIKHSEWQNELILLKDLVLSQPLEETIKWGAPVYTFKGKNIVGLGAFKSYVGLWFFQGALLKDKEQKLVNAQEGKTQAMRQWRFNSLSEIEANSSLITDYVKEAVANQKAGKEIKPKAGKPLEIPLELQEVFHKDTELKEAFEALNLTRKRDFAEYITLAKRAETKQSRLEKIIPMIRQGIGLNDKYK